MPQRAVSEEFGAARDVGWGNVGQLSRELIFGPLVQIGDARRMMNAVHLWPRRALNSGSGDA